MTRSYLSLGSNVDPEPHLYAALQALQALADAPLQLSQVYMSAAVGFEGAPFYNFVVALDTPLSAAALSTQCQKIEYAQGRRREDGKKFTSRTLDIDLLLHGDTIDPAGALPHPDIDRYTFVLRPLAELAPDQRHPILGGTYAALWSTFPREASPPLHRVEGLRERWLTALQPAARFPHKL